MPYFYSAELAGGGSQGAFGSAPTTASSSTARRWRNTWSRSGQIPIVMDLVDVDSDKWTQYASFTKFPFSAIYRREGTNSAGIRAEGLREGSLRRGVHGTRGATGCDRLLRRRDVHVVPNGVDTSYFKPGRRAARANRPTVIFTGDMSYFPNEEAVAYFAQQGTAAHSPVGCAEPGF